MTSTTNQLGKTEITLRPINTLLVANRGEIAVRIMRTAQSMGIRTVAVYSDADANALHVKVADIAVRIGPALPSESYLDITAVITAAKKSGADAIHPGYGFLSENPDFAQACDEAGIIFVGPDAQSMRAMGLKDAAKALMEEAGVPVVPGFHGDNQDAAFLAQQATKIGYPVLIKARAGGGGKGMRKVDSPDQFGASLEAAQREGASSFGDSTVLIEKYIERPRHIEVQVFGDQYGQCVHLFERDCSLQRRHQKVIEEAPAPDMPDELRDAMTKAAIRTAQSVNYVGAGTVEFIVDASGPLRVDGFWFMEMNTRLQVEHPVTEAITGFDLVEWQLLVASGHRLPVQQSDIKLQGHSVEARLYAEDVSAGFLPATGTLHKFDLPSHAGRVYAGMAQGDVVEPYYDPMLAKLVSHGSDRATAFRQLHHMLDKSVVIGVTTNRAFLAELCSHEEVLAGRVHTGLIEQEYQPDDGADSSQATNIDLDATIALAAVMSVCLPASTTGTTDRYEVLQEVQQDSVYSRLGVWQIWGEPTRLVDLQVNHQTCTLQVVRVNTNDWRVTLDSKSAAPKGESKGVVNPAAAKSDAVHLTINNLNALAYGTSIEVDGTDVYAIGVSHGESIFCRVGQNEAHIKRPVVEHAEGAAQGGLHLLSPMPGRIIAVHSQSGDTVSKGDVLMTLEAMKMEHSLIAVADARIDTVLVNKGDQVEQGMRLVLFDQE